MIMSINDKVLSTGYAVNVEQTKFIPCSICSHLENNLADHLIFKCSKFATSQAKIVKKYESMCLLLKF